MLSKTAEYALRALLVLARRGTAGTVRAEEIADAVGAPRNYMAKTLHALTKEGLVASARGPLGGFTLTVAPDSISVARVADAFTEARGTGLCLLGDGPCDRAAPCAAHARWTSVRAAARERVARGREVARPRDPRDRDRPVRTDGERRRRVVVGAAEVRREDER